MDATATANAVLIDWNTLITSALGAAVGAGIIGAYLRKRAENLATKQDIRAITSVVEAVKAEFQQAHEAQRHVNERALKSMDYEHQLRVAALERRLDEHQGAYARWWTLQSKMYAPEAHHIAVECQLWWVEHNIFLDPQAREAFRDAYLAVGVMVQLKGDQDAESVRVWREQVETVRKAGNIIAKAVALPPITLKPGPEEPPAPAGGPAPR
jgi:hypothetical protein